MKIVKIMILNKEKNIEIGVTLDIQKLLIRIVKLVKRYMVWSLRVTSFFFLFSVSPLVGVLFFFHFFSLCQGVTKVEYICKDILGVRGGKCPLPRPPLALPLPILYIPLLPIKV